MNALLCVTGLGVASFIYQALTDQQWFVAWERAFFQGTAVFTYALVLYLQRERI